MSPKVLSPVQPDGEDAAIARDALVRVRKALAGQRDSHEPVRLTTAFSLRDSIAVLRASKVSCAPRASEDVSSVTLRWTLPSYLAASQAFLASAIIETS